MQAAERCIYGKQREETKFYGGNVSETGCVCQPNNLCDKFVVSLSTVTTSDVKFSSK